MNDKQQKLLLSLSDTDHKTTKTLSYETGFSVRSIKTYVKEIRAEYPDLIISNTQGYILNPKEKISIDNETPKGIERDQYILINVIKHPHLNTIDYYAETLFVSESTIRNDLKKISKMVAKFDLELEIKHNKIFIIGLEKMKRKLLTTILYQESKDHFFNARNLQTSFPEFDVARIQEIIIEVLSSEHYFINDYALMNLLLHVVVALHRIRNYNTQSIEETSTEYNPESYHTAKLLATRFESLYNIVFTQGEINELALLLLSLGININSNKLEKKSLTKVMSKDVLELVQSIIDGINEYYYIDISEDQFFVRFALHINNLLKRLRIGRTNKNPIVTSIKENCPLIYDCAVHASLKISNFSDYEISEDEIGYIAFHLGGALETQKYQEDKLRTVILAPEYHELSTKLYNDITTRNENDILVQHVLNTVDEITNIKGDLIISTQPILSSISIPVVVISPFYTTQDHQNIQKKVHQLKAQRQQQRFQELLDMYFLEEHFYHQTTPLTQIEVIQKMVGILEQEEYVLDTFIQEVYEREHLSTTAFGQVAIPHSIKMNAQKTSISMLVSDSIIEWGTNEVSIVVLISIAKRDRKLFANLFDVLAMILTDPEIIEALHRQPTYENSVREIVSRVS